MTLYVHFYHFYMRTCYVAIRTCYIAIRTCYVAIRTCYVAIRTCYVAIIIPHMAPGARLALALWSVFALSHPLYSKYSYSCSVCAAESHV